MGHGHWLFLLGVGLGWATASAAANGSYKRSPPTSASAGFFPSELLYTTIRTTPGWKLGHRVIALSDGQTNILTVRPGFHPRGTLILERYKPHNDVGAQLSLTADTSALAQTPAWQRIRGLLQKSAKTPKEVAPSSVKWKRGDERIVQAWQHEWERRQGRGGYLDRLALIVDAVKRTNPSFEIYLLGDVNLDGTFFPIFGSRKTGLGMVPYYDGKIAIVMPSLGGGALGNIAQVVLQLP